MENCTLIFSQNLKIAEQLKGNFSIDKYLEREERKNNKKIRGLDLNKLFLFDYLFKGKKSQECSRKKNFPKKICFHLKFVAKKKTNYIVPYDLY